MKPPSSSHLLVALQMTAIALCAYPFAAHDSARLYWLLISVAGGVVGIYVLLHNRIGNFGVYPEPKDGCCLITTGPYRWIRHPMYLSLFLGMLGIVLYHQNVMNFVGLGLLLLAISGKMIKEEKYLHSQFGDYAEYKQGTKRLLPFVY